MVDSFVDGARRQPDGDMMMVSTRMSGPSRLLRSFRVNLLMPLGCILASCGGPLLLTPILVPLLGGPGAFLVTFSPLGLMLVASREGSGGRGRHARWIRQVGKIGAWLNLSIQVWGAWTLAVAPPPHGQGLLWVGIAMGVSGSAAYLWPLRPMSVRARGLSSPEPPGGVSERPAQAFVPPRTSLICQVSPMRQVGLLALALAMVALSYLCTTLPGWVPKGAGWVGVAFFGLALAIIPFKAFRRGPQVILDALGIEDRRLQVGRIPWTEVEAISVVQVHSSRFLALHLVPGAGVMERLSPTQKRMAAMNESLGFPPVTLTFTGLTPGLPDVLRHLGIEG